MVRYKVVGKVGIVTVVGWLPRAGDLIIFPTEKNELARFRVREVQHGLRRTTSPDVYDSITPEVFVDLID